MPEVGLPLVQGSSDLWVLGGYGAEYSLNRGWLQDYAINSTGGRTTNCAPSTATAFLSTGDGTTGSGNSFYAIGRALQVVHSGGTAYPLVTSASYSTTTLQTTVGLGFFSSVGTTSLSTGGITSVGAAPQPGFGQSGSTTPATATRFHREDGQWATPAGGSTHAYAALGADVSSTAANVWYDGPSVVLSTGRWLILGNLTMNENAGGSSLEARLGDGSTWVTQGGGALAVGYFTTIPLSYVFNNTVANSTMKLQGTSDDATFTIKATALSNPATAAGNTSSTITAIRLSD